MWYSLAQKSKKDLISTCIVIRIKKDNIEVLLCKRGTNPNKYEWCIPGGHIEENEKPIDAAVRELKEETNLDLNKNNLFLIDEVENNNIKNYIFTIFESEYNKEKAGSDAEDVAWFEINKIPVLIWDNNIHIDKALQFLMQKL